MTLYDEVEYPSRAFSHTHPERAAAIGTLLGLPPPEPAISRVLEVGCGSGWNLIPMAAASPCMQLFGFDLAESAIEAAKRDAGALGLTNVRFEHLDLMDFPADLGPFDYIIAHGFYSWVPEHVRLRLLDLCRDRLSRHGLAFISFNAYPYGRLRRMWRDMMSYHAAHTGAAAATELLEHSEALLRTLRDQWTKSSRLQFHAKLLDAQINAISAGGGNWFFHDDLGPVFEPFEVRHFSIELESHGLRYASEALFEDLPLNGLPDTLVAAAGSDWMAREQYWDNLVFRGFHSSLICHREATLQRPPTLEAFEQLRYSAPLTRVSPQVFRNDWTSSEAESEDPATLAALQRLADVWPNNMSSEDLQASPSTLRDLTYANVIEPSVSTRHFNHSKITLDAPKVWDPARLQARRGKVVTNRLHGAIQLEQEPLRQLVIALDGTRPLWDLRYLFASEQELQAQLQWLYRAALLQ